MKDAICRILFILIASVFMPLIWAGLVVRLAFEMAVLGWHVGEWLFDLALNHIGMINHNGEDSK